MNYVKNNVLINNNSSNHESKTTDDESNAQSTEHGLPAGGLYQPIAVGTRL
ncbi:hypothetical protein GCM10028791_22080 [Echinicola sediminis]